MSADTPITELANNSDSELTTPGAVTVKRRFNVNINGSLTNFGLEGPDAATWRPAASNIATVFGPAEDQLNGNPADHTSTINSLRNAVIKKCTIIESRSTFPVPLGVKISSLPQDEFTEDGLSFNATVLPNSLNSTPQVVFEAESTNLDSENWHKNYGQYNASNLASYNVLEVQQCPYLFVHENHPVIALLRANRDLLKADIDAQPKIDNEWYKVTRQVFNSCCNTLKSKILNRLNTRDLNAFSIQLVRLKNQEWSDLESMEDALVDINYPMDVVCSDNPEQMDKYKRWHLQNFLEKHYAYNARVELVYELQP